MKMLKVFMVVPAILGLLICAGGCDKKPPPPWPSYSFVGNFSGTGSCLLNGVQADTIHILATGSTQVSITNLYGLPQAVNGTVSNDTCNIQPQICDGYILQGILLLSSDTINFSIIASSFGRDDKCNGVLLKY